MCGEVTHAAYEQPFRSPLQGESRLEPDPGLEALGYSVMPLRGNRPVTLSPFRRHADTPTRSGWHAVC
jgi:hypothetical protein